MLLGHAFAGLVAGGYHAQQFRQKLAANFREMKRPSAYARTEGLTLAEAIGNDMPPLDGYLDHEVIQDVNDPGHLMVNTHWQSQAQAQAVLNHYQHDAKTTRATELLKASPVGFIGAVRPGGKQVLSADK